MAPTIPRPSPSSVTSSNSNDGPTAFTSDEEPDMNSSSKPVYRHWPFCDEVKILTTMAALRRENRQLPGPSKVLETLRKCEEGLKREKVTYTDLKKKISNLKKKFKTTISKKASKETLQHGERNDRLFELSQEVWPKLMQSSLIGSSSSSVEVISEMAPIGSSSSPIEVISEMAPIGSSSSPVQITSSNEASPIEIITISSSSSDGED